MRGVRGQVVRVAELVPVISVRHANAAKGLIDGRDCGVLHHPALADLHVVGQLHAPPVPDLARRREKPRVAVPAGKAMDVLIVPAGQRSRGPADESDRDDLLVGVDHNTLVPLVVAVEAVDAVAWLQAHPPLKQPALGVGSAGHHRDVLDCPLKAGRPCRDGRCAASGGALGGCCSSRRDGLGGTRPARVVVALGPRALSRRPGGSAVSRQVAAAEKSAPGVRPRQWSQVFQHVRLRVVAGVRVPGHGGHSAQVVVLVVVGARRNLPQCRACSLLHVGDA